MQDVPKNPKNRTGSEEREERGIYLSQVWSLSCPIGGHHLFRALLLSHPMMGEREGKRGGG